MFVCWCRCWCACVWVCVCVVFILIKIYYFSGRVYSFFCHSRVFPLPSISRCCCEIRFFVNAVCLFYHRGRCCRRRHFSFIHSLASRHHLISLHSILFSVLNVLGIRKSKLNEWKEKQTKHSSAWQIYCQRYLPFKFHVSGCVCAACCVPCLNVNKIVCPWLKKSRKLITERALSMLFCLSSFLSRFLFFLHTFSVLLIFSIRFQLFGITMTTTTVATKAGDIGWNETKMPSLMIKSRVMGLFICATLPFFQATAAKENYRVQIAESISGCPRSCLLNKI